MLAYSAYLSIYGVDLKKVVDPSLKNARRLRHGDKSAPGYFGTCVRHFGTKTNRHPDNSAPQLDKSAPQKDKLALVFFSLIIRYVQNFQ
jgi:hypothetical protein